MSFFSRLRDSLYMEPDAAQRVLPEPFEPFMGTGGIPVMDPGFPLDWAWSGGGGRVNPALIWQTQPSVRKVIGYIARNVATIPLNLYARNSDEDRERIREGSLASILRAPRDRMSAERFWESVISDWLLYDRWAVLLAPNRAAGGRMELVQIPSWRLRFRLDDFRRVESVWMWKGGAWDDEQAWREIPMGSVIFDYGYAPSSAGVSPIDTLADILAEQIEQVRYNRQVWQNGARIPLMLLRPAEAPTWSSEARSRFAEGFKSNYANVNAPNAGGTPVLEDGMKPHELRSFTAKDMQAVEARQLTDIEVASAFHIAPEMIGARQGSYSSLREFRRRLWQIDLAPYVSMWEGALNSQLIPMLADPGRELYIEANIEAKMRGDFFEQSEVKSRAVGGPWLTRNEARAMENRKPVDDGDVMITPLNVTQGGLANPADTGRQNITDGDRVGEGKASSFRPRLKSVQVSDAQRKRFARVLADFFDRQGRSVLSSIGAGGEWWDGERWDDELSADLQPLMVALSSALGTKTVRQLGFPSSDWNEAQTLAYWEKVARSTAEALNATTFEQVTSALEDPGDGTITDAVQHVFDVASESRAEQSGITATTMVAGFAAVEAGKQIVAKRGGRSRKTWVVTSGNPREEHALMDGETVDVEETFSNGMLWPGDTGRGSVDEIAGCQCALDIWIDS